jgi:hypothetical protein
MAASFARSRLAKRTAEREWWDVPAPWLRAISSLPHHADVAELVDARRSGRRARKGVEVRVLSSAFRSIYGFAEPSELGELLRSELGISPSTETRDRYSRLLASALAADAGSDRDEQLTWSRETVGCLEAGERRLDLLPCRRLLCGVEAREHLVQGAE